MTDFTIHTQATAPATSKPLLDKSLKAFGRVPGLHGVLAEAPKALEAYQISIDWRATFYSRPFFATVEVAVVKPGTFSGTDFLTGLTSPSFAPIL